MSTIQMTAEQTATYDADGAEAVELMRTLREQAQARLEETGEPVEILTADGIVADFVQ